MTTPTVPPMDHDEVEELAAPFVLGALDAASADAVRAHLATCDRPHPEILELGGVVGYLADTATPIEPADALGARIMAAVRDEDRASPATAVGPVAPRAGPRLGRVPGWWRVIAVAVAVIAVVLAGTTVQLAGRLADAQGYADQLSQAAALAATPGSRTAPMAPAVAGGPSGLAVVASAAPGRVVLSGLAPIAGSEVYEVWLIGGDGRPVPAGALHATGAGTGWLDTLAPVGEGPVTVAVTREPGPGATTPTLPILSSGAAG
jgi:anti-sigma-K factor RskA